MNLLTADFSSRSKAGPRPAHGQGQSTSETGQDRCGTEDFSVVPKKANGEYDRLPALAVELVNRQVAAIVAGGVVAAQAAKVTTTTIPIVLNSGVDPVTAGSSPASAGRAAMLPERVRLL